MLDLFVEEGVDRISTLVRGERGLKTEELARLAAEGALGPAQDLATTIKEQLEKLPGGGGGGIPNPGEIGERLGEAIMTAALEKLDEWLRTKGIFE